MRRVVLAFGVIVLVTAALRLLIAGGGAAFTPPGLPADNAWSRSGSNPVVSPTQAWEETSIQEPVVARSGLTLRMWYKGGWASGGALGYATSSDGLTWTHYASNPILGRGGSGLAATTSQPQILDVSGTLYLYINSPGDTTNSAYLYTSTDGLSWAIANGGTAYITSGSITSWGNRFTWREGATWYQLQEGRIGAGLWQMYLLSSSDGITDWAFLNSGNPLTTLKPGALYNVGGPCLASGGARAGTYHLYYHSGTGSTSDIYHSTSTDRITWTTPAVVLTHSGSGDEVDQIADPDIALIDGVWYMWFAGVDNTGTTGRILLATAAAT